MISFRLTAEEYAKFRQLCLEHGIRSFSEMARVAINLLLQEPARTTDIAIESRLANLESRVHMLSQEVKRLSSVAVTSNGTSLE